MWRVLTFLSKKQLQNHFFKKYHLENLESFSRAWARKVAATPRTSNAVFYHNYVSTLYSIIFLAKAPTSFAPEVSVNRCGHQWTSFSAALARKVAATPRTFNAVFYHIYVSTLYSINFGAKAPTSFVPEIAVKVNCKISNADQPSNSRQSAVNHPSIIRQSSVDHPSIIRCPSIIILSYSFLC